MKHLNCGIDLWTVLTVCALKRNVLSNVGYAAVYGGDLHSVFKDVFLFFPPCF